MLTIITIASKELITVSAFVNWPAATHIHQVRYPEVAVKPRLTAELYEAKAYQKPVIFR